MRGGWLDGDIAMTALKVGQTVEVVGTPHAGLTGIIVNITPSGRYHEVRTDNGVMVFLARQLKAKA